MKLTILAFAIILAIVVDLSAQTFTVLHDFTGSDGEHSVASLFLSGNTLYGTTAEGGGSGYGTVFKVNTDGSNFNSLHSLTGSDGQYPDAGLVLLGNTLYGTTFGDHESSEGTVFQVNTDGSNFNNLHNFSGTDLSGGYTNFDGANSCAGLFLSGNTLYGTAESGGSLGDGTVFRINTDGSDFQNLHSFTVNDGALPVANLILSGNTLYGTTEHGGSSGSGGTVFSVNTDGSNFNSLHSFLAANYPSYTNIGGAYPMAGLVLSGNTLYGTTYIGGSSGDGIVFSITTNGQNFAILHSFTNYPDGANPYAGLILSGNTLYGTTYSGGSSFNGTVFEVNTDGSHFTILYSFIWPHDGGGPQAGLILSGNVLYGTTFSGGSGDAENGTVFSLTLPTSAPTITTQPQSLTVQVGSNVIFTVVASGSPSPNYQWYFNSNPLTGQTAASLSLNNVQLSNGGNYSVAIANAYGSTNSAIAQLIVYTNLVLVQTNRTPPATAIGPPTIPTNPNYFKVFTNGNFQSGIALNPNKNTVVLTHGWNSSSTDWPHDMAQLIQQRIGSNTVNLVAWDWTTDATSSIPNLGVIAAKTPGEGFALGTNLVAALGANYSKRIHFIGHSLGTLVNAAAANYVHSHGFSWTNTQMTLCDDAEIAWDFSNPNDPQFASTVYATVTNLEANFSTSQPLWGTTLPTNCAWADNYITAFGLLHPGAANVILTYSYPTVVEDLDTLKQEFFNYHDYSYDFYEDTIEPNILMNNGGQTNATYAGFICSYEGGGANARPATNTYFYQDQKGLELNLVQIDMGSATNFLNDRFNNFLAIGAFVYQNSSTENWLKIQALEIKGEVLGQQSTVGTIVNLITSMTNSSQIQSLGVRPMGGPVPNGQSANNTPAYIWIPLDIPSNAVSLSFDFMLQGNGNQDSFQAALNGTNVLSLETSLIQTNVALNSGMINVSQYAGQQVELFLGIVGGTSTNASLTICDFNLYVTLPPALQVQLAGTNSIVSWPLSANGYTLETTTNLANPNFWTALTNVPAAINFQNTITNRVVGSQGFYRLIQSQ
jgi:uncharacterized repeat protein (TIGR03803 family)